MREYNDSLRMTIKLKIKYRYRAAAMLLFYVLQKTALTEVSYL
jgi:hypothetical protein